VAEGGGVHRKGRQKGERGVLRLDSPFCFTPLAIMENTKGIVRLRRCRKWNILTATRPAIKFQTPACEDAEARGLVP